MYMGIHRQNNAFRMNIPEKSFSDSPQLLVAIVVCVLSRCTGEVITRVTVGEAMVVSNDGHAVNICKTDR